MKQQKDNIFIITKWIFDSLLVLSILEVAFFPDAPNVYGCSTFIIGWILLYSLVLRIKGTERNKCLFPYLALFFLGVSFFWLPLVVTFIEGKPLTFNFENPYLTFSNQLLNLIMMIAAYRLCLRIYHPHNIIQRFWERIGYFTPPTELQIWILGFIGFASFVFFLTIQGTEEADAGNLGFSGHLLQVTRNFITFPFLLLFKDLLGINKVSSKHSILLFIYFLFVVALGVATGKRTPIIGPVVTIVLCYLLPVFTRNKRVFSKKNSLLCLIFLYLVTGPVADFAAAMMLGRDDSSRTSASKTLDNIIKIYQDKELLHRLYQIALAYSDNGGNNDSGWSEYYVDNILLDRFCNLRVCDATLYYAQKLGYDNPVMHEYTKKQVLYLIPTPVLNAFGIMDDKFSEQYSPGDLLSSEGLNYNRRYHGYRVAGDTGIGLYLWGYGYYLWAFFIYAAFFYLLSTKVLILKNGRVILSLMSACELYTILWLLNNSSGIIRILHLLLRDIWQEIIVFCVLYYIIRIISFSHNRTNIELL